MLGELFDSYPIWDRYTQLVPNRVRHKIRLRRHGSHFPDVYRRLNCVYVHVPKTAGTAVAKAIFDDANIGHAHYVSEDYRLEDPVFFANSFKFAFVRNPWDRLLSSYRYTHSPPEWVGPRTLQFSEYLNKRYPTFDQFVLGLEQSSRMQRWTHNIPQIDFIAGRNGRIQVDFVGRFEELDAGLDYVSQQLGLKQPPALARLNESQGEKGSYADFYNARTKDIVWKIYRKEIEYFDYEYVG